MSVAGKYKRWLPPVVLALVCMIALFVLWVGYHGGRWGLDLIAQRIWMGKEVFQEVPFDRSKWLSYKNYQPQNIRKRMYHDLVSHHLKVGMSQQEVLKLLGKPEFKRGTSYYYHLGPDSANIDTNELVVEFDRSDKVVRVDWHET